LFGASTNTNTGSLFGQPAANTFGQQQQQQTGFSKYNPQSVFLCTWVLVLVVLPLTLHTFFPPESLVTSTFLYLL
jgi:hypothetical protein